MNVSQKCSLDNWHEDLRELQRLKQQKRSQYFTLLIESDTTLGQHRLHEITSKETPTHKCIAIKASWCCCLWLVRVATSQPSDWLKPSWHPPQGLWDHIKDCDYLSLHDIRTSPKKLKYAAQGAPCTGRKIYGTEPRCLDIIIRLNLHL